MRAGEFFIYAWPRKVPENWGIIIVVDFEGVAKENFLYYIKIRI